MMLLWMCCSYEERQNQKRICERIGNTITSVIEDHKEGTKGAY